MPRVLGISMHGGSLMDAVDTVIDVCSSVRHKDNRLISATSAHGLVLARRKPEFRRLLRGFFLNLADGWPVAWVGRRLKGAVAMEQCRGSDFFRAVIERSANRPIKHFFCGGKPGVAARLRDVCADRYGNRNCAGVFSPPFHEMTDQEIQALAEQINRSGADIVWIGLSTPKQEVFATRLARFTAVHFLATIGAAFDFHVGNVKEAPQIFRRLGIEWLYRLSTEPRRLYRRYSEVVPLFILYNLIDLVRAGAGERDGLIDMPKVLGVPIYGSSLTDAMDSVIDECCPGRCKDNGLISATNAHGLVIARQRPAFGTILRSFFLNLVAGKPTAWVGRRLKGAAGMEQCRGSDFFRAVIERSANRPIKHFFCGGKAGVANKLKEVCEERYGNRNWVGSRWGLSGETPDRELRKLADEINGSGADIVWIGLSTPEQEEFAARLARFTKVRFLVTVGATVFDFHADRAKEAPACIRFLYLEWLHWVCIEPRLYRRYGKVVPLFILYNLIDLIGR